MDTEALALQVAEVRPRAERLVSLERDFRSFKEHYVKNVFITYAFSDHVGPSTLGEAEKLPTAEELQQRYAAAIQGGRAVLRKMVSHFEILAAGVCVQDAFHMLTVTTQAELVARAAEVRRYVQACAGLDLVHVVDEGRSVGTLPSDPQRREFAVKPLDEVLRYARYALDFEPELVRAVDVLGREPELSAPVHRVRRAWAVIEAFLYRNDPQLQAAVKTAGLAYAAGRLQLKEVSALIGRPEEDVIVEFERCGFHRPLPVIRLDEAERGKLFQRIREDRLAREGKPAPKPEAMRRDVIATQRIEGVDARPWLKPVS